MKILGYIFKRFAMGVPTLFGLIVIVFFLSRVIPANPAMNIAGEAATPAQIRELEKRYGFDQPLYTQFLNYLKKLSRGDLGVALRSNRPVVDELKRRFPPTFELAVSAITLSIFLGVPLGILAALRRNTWVDHLVRTFTIGGVAIASFWLGIMLQLGFSLYLRIFPLGGQMSLTPPPPVTGLVVVDSILALDGAGLLDALHHLALPAVTLCLPGLATISRFTRSGYIGVIQSDYVLYARSMGLSRKLIVFKYILRNAIVATVTQIGLIAGLLLAGSVIIEYVYFRPGVGAYLIEVILNFDYDGILGTTLFIGVIFLVINIAVDILQAYLDPKILDTL